MIRSNLCDYSDACILVRGTTKINGSRDNDTAKRTGHRNKRIILKDCAPFNECLSNINNTQIDIARYRYR